MIVADSNLISCLMIPGQQTVDAQAVLRKDPLWAAPLLWRSEFRNVLALYLRQKHLTLADALHFAEAAEALLRGREYQVESAPVLRLAEQSGRSAYDCEFVHLAEELQVPLVTSDRKVLGAFPNRAISMQDFTK
ncbi:MAG TPA: type II toxin-antitoxin system VapC family toxin [Longimicrobiaceae bacterium]|nr:type II toxin-antitoxin system VapC family toxin [Longimicrobiaceae bacterium]